MVRVGVHVSIAGSLDRAVSRAEERGCDSFQIFTKNPRGWAAKEITQDIADAFIGSVQRSSLWPPVAHMPYLPNLASEKPDIYDKSCQALSAELHRCTLLHIPYLVTHLGHAGDTPKAGRDRVICAIQHALDEDESAVRLLLENTAGERNSVGSRLEDLREVLDGINQPDKTGVCFDTCHAFAAGYDMRTQQAVKTLISQINDTIGIKMVYLIHLNDTKGKCGSGLDRHEHIGCGCIGEVGIQALLRHPLIQNIPIICETPVDERRTDAENIEVVRRLARTDG